MQFIGTARIWTAGNLDPAKLSLVGGSPHLEGMGREHRARIRTIFPPVYVPSTPMKQPSKSLVLFNFFLLKKIESSASESADIYRLRRAHTEGNAVKEKDLQTFKTPKHHCL